MDQADRIACIVILAADHRIEAVLGEEAGPFLKLLGVEIPAKQGKGLLKYCERLFRRDGFQASLSDREREIRQPY